LVSIHSIDSIKILNKLLSKKVAMRIGIFLQVNTAGEESKAGFTDKNELCQAIDLIKAAREEQFYVQGLMTIGPIHVQDFLKEATESFSLLAQMSKELTLVYPKIRFELSMGMSQDYELALDAGSDWLRIGSEIFGNRDQ